MKSKNIWMITALIALAAILMGATSDRRDNSRQFSVARYEFTQQTWASGVTATATTTINNITGVCEMMEVILNDNTNNVTATVTLTTQNSGQVFTKAAIAENATTVYKATSDATDYDAFLSHGTLTATITPSGDPGASGLTVDVICYMR